jgi:hypothetical protein
MKTFKTQFNPLMSIGRLAIVVLLTIVLFTMLTHKNYMGYYADSNQETKHILSIIFVAGLLILSTFFLFSRAKDFDIDEDKIVVHSLFTFSKTTYNKEDVYGFVTPYIKGTGLYSISYRKIVIYVKKGKPLELTQYTHFNFEDTFKALRSSGYRYFASEHEASEFFDNLEKSNKV